MEERKKKLKYTIKNDYCFEMLNKCKGVVRVNPPTGVIPNEHIKSRKYLTRSQDLWCQSVCRNQANNFFLQNM